MKQSPLERSPGVRESCVPKETIVCRVQGSSPPCKDLHLSRGHHRLTSGPSLSAVPILTKWGPGNMEEEHTNGFLMSEQGRDLGRH